MTKTKLRTLPNKELERMARDLLREAAQDRQENALEHYIPANPDAEPAHYSTAREVAIVGGHRSGKSDSMLAELAIQMTGIVPACLQDRYPQAKLRPPIRARLFCTSFQNAFDVQLKRKLQWFEWDGQDAPGGARGHWGWIPRRFLINRSWDQSWSEKQRTLRLANGSVMWVLSYEQSTSDVKVGSYHFIGEDELGPENFHRQNRTRIMETKGQLWCAATPPDNRGEALSAAWFYDQVYMPGLKGTDPDIFAVQVNTDRNRLLLTEDIEWMLKGLDSEQKGAHLSGTFLHLSGRVFPEFADLPRTWCFQCDSEVHSVHGDCQRCGGTDITEYCHVRPSEPLPTAWPRVFYFDPHPRRPLAGVWLAVSPADEWIIEHEIEVDPYGGPSVVKRAIEDYEQEHAIYCAYRMGDSNMSRQHNEYAGEDWTIGKALRDVGFDFVDANMSKETGHAFLRDAMRCNRWTRRPRLLVMDRCKRVIHQMSRWAFAEHGVRAVGRADREIEQDKHSDFPSTLRMMANDQPSYQSVVHNNDAEVVRYAFTPGR